MLCAVLELLDRRRRSEAAGPQETQLQSGRCVSYGLSCSGPASERDQEARIPRYLHLVDVYDAFRRIPLVIWASSALVASSIPGILAFCISFSLPAL